MTSITDYDEAIEKITFYFIANSAGMISGKELDTSVREVFDEVEDPFIFTLTLVKWVQALVVHGSSKTEQSGIEYLADFYGLLTEVQNSHE